MRLRDPGLLRLLSFENDECSLCGATQHLHLHHVVLRSQGGDDVRANILCLCRGCHDGYHLRRGDGYGARLVAYVRAERPDIVDYLVDKLGEHGAARWFEVNSE